MRIALAVLCIAAVTFLLRVLVALVREAVSKQPRDKQVYLAKFSPSRRPAELVVINSESQQRNSASGEGERMALAALVTAGLFAIGTISGEPLCKTLFG